MINLLLALIGGLGLLIFGLREMGRGFQKVFGNNLIKVIKSPHKIRFSWVYMGFIINWILQNIKTSILVIIGFANGEAISLQQGVGLIVGASLGSALTVQVLVFDPGFYTFALIGLGVFFNTRSSAKPLKFMGQILFSLGLIFLGKQIISEGIINISPSLWSSLIAPILWSPLKSLFLGIILAILLRNSIVTITILMALAIGGAPHAGILAVIAGDYLGTGLLAFMASLRATNKALRMSLGYLIFSGVSVILVLLFAPSLLKMVPAAAVSSKYLVAVEYLAFQLFNILILLPLIKPALILASRIIPEEKFQKTEMLHYIDHRFLDTPAIALEQTKKEIIRAALLVQEGLAMVTKAFFENDNNLTKQVFVKEEQINSLVKEIIIALTNLSAKVMTQEQSFKITHFSHAVSDFERVGDRVKNIAELTDYKIAEKLPFTATALAEMKELFNQASHFLSQTVVAFENEDQALAQELFELEEAMDEKELALRMSHICRLNEGKCFPGAGVVYLDIIANLERIGDHSLNIAHSILGEI